MSHALVHAGGRHRYRPRVGYGTDSVAPAAGLSLADAVVEPVTLERKTLFVVTILPIVLGYFVLL